MKRVIYSTRPDAYRDVCESPQVYIGPRSVVSELRIKGCVVVPIEDIDKTAEWLRLNEIVQRGTPMVYDRAARYFRIESEIARRLERLSSVSGNVSLVDVVPFCERIHNLYVTWRYIDRSILGHAHYYAFAGGHAEMFRGRVVGSLDPSLLAFKVNPHCIAENVMSQRRRIVRVESTASELIEYKVRRDILFEEQKTARVIVTRLADFSHSTKSRVDSVRGMLQSGDSVVCNMSTSAAKYKTFGASVGTYSSPPSMSCSRLIFAEPPIVNPQWRWDIESRVRDSEVIDVAGDFKIDAYLSGRTLGEVESVSRFVSMLEPA